MSKNNKDKPFYLSPHEKKISEFYQNNKRHQGEEPSAQLDSEIMAMAKQHFKVNHSLLTKQQTLNEQPHIDKGTYSKIKVMAMATLIGGFCRYCKCFVDDSKRLFYSSK